MNNTRPDFIPRGGVEAVRLCACCIGGKEAVFSLVLLLALLAIGLADEEEVAEVGIDEDT